ncbi:hypothetical protein IFR05_014189 [Cadophora sp. M221]|nr:hypothetical protein IFR05_014189 [Cadophora sp. M221]
MAVLSAPSSPHEIRVLSVVIAVVSVLSALGAGWIILSFMEADYWVLSIAICTYLILASHKTQSSWVQDHKLVVWVVPWFLSLLWAAIGLAVVGYGNIGAWCWFTSDRVRLLVNFLPRWLIIIAILALYIRLYFIIRKAHTRFMSFDDERDDAIGSLRQTESDSSRLRSGNGSGNRSACGRDSLPTQELEMSSSISKSAEGDYERGVRSPPTTTPTTTHTRIGIGRASPVLKRMMTYPLVYMLIWTIPTTIRVYQATTNDSAPFVIGTIDKACIVIQGFADAIVYGFNESTWRLWREFLL